MKKQTMKEFGKYYSILAKTKLRIDFVFHILCVYAIRYVCSSAKKISEIEEDQARKGHLYTKCLRNNELWCKDKGKAYNLLLFVAFFYVYVFVIHGLCTVESH